MYLPGTKAQTKLDVLYDESGTTAGGAQLVRAQVPSCSHFFIQNIATTGNPLYVEFGAARATATITSGAVTSLTVTNGGFGYTYPPLVRFAGGGNAGNTKNLGLNLPGGEGPNSSITAGRPAQAYAVLTTGIVTSIVITDPGAGYVKAPKVWLTNDINDPYGCASPFFGSTASGIILTVNGGGYNMNGTVCPTDPVSIYCASASQPFTFKWMV